MSDIEDYVDQQPMAEENEDVASDQSNEDLSPVDSSSEEETSDVETADITANTSLAQAVEDVPSSAVVQEAPASEKTSEFEAELPGTAKTAQDACAGECPLTQLRANSAYQRASRLFHWRDPVESGLALASVTFSYFLLTSGAYSLLTLTAYTLLCGLLISGLYVNGMILFAKLKKKPAVHPFGQKFDQFNLSISSEDVEPYVQFSVILINAFLKKFGSIYYCSNNVESLKYVAILSVLGSVGSWFSGATLLYLVLLGFFIWPRLYEEKKKEIDQYYGIAMSHIMNVVSQIQSKIPIKPKRLKLE